MSADIVLRLWISWSPFRRTFIARVSRGRTVREFIVCVLLIPSLVCVLWMSVFGGTAIQQFLETGFNGVLDAPLELKLFEMLGQLPLASLTSLVGIVLVIVFFVTSSDSGSLVIDTITAGGKIDAPVPQRVFWCTFEGAVAMVLLLSAGGLASLQSMVIFPRPGFRAWCWCLCVCISDGAAHGTHAIRTGWRARIAPIGPFPTRPPRLKTGGSLFVFRKGPPMPQIETSRKASRAIPAYDLTQPQCPTWWKPTTLGAGAERGRPCWRRVIGLFWGRATTGKPDL